MKRVFAAVLVFAVLLTAAACAKSGESAWREDCAAIPVIRERYRADLALMEHDIDEVPMCGVRIRNRDNIDDYVVAGHSCAVNTAVEYLARPERSRGLSAMQKKKQQPER